MGDKSKGAENTFKHAKKYTTKKFLLTGCVISCQESDRNRMLKNLISNDHSKFFTTSTPNFFLFFNYEKCQLTPSSPR